MVNKRKIFKIVLPAILIFALVGTSVLFIFGSGLPFLDDPETFEIQESVSFKETDKKVFVSLEKPERADEIVVLSDDEELNWGDNEKIGINKNTSEKIIIESYPENQGLYETYEYEIGSVVNNIRTPDNAFLGEENTYYIQSTAANSELENIKWYVNGTAVSFETLGIDRSFNTTGEKDIRATMEVDGVQYETTTSVNVIEPDEILIDINITKQELKTYETFELSVSELTNQGVENIDINFGNGENTTIEDGSTTRYWYTEPGKYEISVLAESSTLDAQKTQNININVTERQENESETAVFNLNVYDEEGDPIEGAAVSLGSFNRETDSRGFTRIILQPQEYNVRISAPGYFSKSRLIDIQDDLTIEETLVTIGSGDEPEIPSEENDNINLSDTPNEFGVDDETNQSNIPTREDEVNNLVLEAFENLEGEGTQENPYQVSEYIELQSIRVQPSASYEIVNDIDASASSTQYSIDRVNQSIGEAEEGLFELPYIQSRPSDLLIRIDGEVIDSSEYQVVQYDEDPIENSPRFAVAFTEDGEQIPASEALTSAYPSDNVFVNYSVGNTIYKGFEPIDIGGNVINIDGNNNTINNLYINRPLEDDVGLFKNARGGSISDLRVSGEFEGNDRTSAILSSGSEVQISSVEVAGVILGEEEVGAVVGDLQDSTIEDTTSYAEVRGSDKVGGIVGSISEGTRRSLITNTVTKLDEQAAIYGRYQVGGIVGYASGTDIIESYSISQIGIINSDDPRVGGVVGELTGSAELDKVFSVAPMSTVSTEGDKISSVGAIVGHNKGNIRNSYWSQTIGSSPESAIGNSSENSSNNNINGLNDEAMKGSVAESNMLNFDFENTWDTTESYPILQSEIDRFQLNVRVEKSNSDLQSPTIRIIRNGEQQQTLELENGDLITEQFNLVSGSYTIQFESENHSDQESIELDSNTQVRFQFTENENSNL
jgi:hypothetical protein